MVQCFAPLLYKWFLSHLPKEGPFVQNKDNIKWSRRIMSLTVADIFWYSREYGDVKIIVSCGQGCINYSHVLAMQQLGFPIVDKPEDNSLEGFVFGEGVKDFDLVKKISCAWTKVYREGRKEWEKIIV